MNFNHLKDLSSNIRLKHLDIYDGKGVYDMLQEIPLEENGYHNGVNGILYNEFREWLMKSKSKENGIGLEDWQVPQSIYWLYVDDEPVGIGKIRHRLTDKLLEEGGNIAYAIKPSARGKGYATKLLQLLIKEAKEHNINELLATILVHNEASLKVALKNGGILKNQNDKRYYVWFDLD